ncbi:MAG: hypothetical protein QOF14_4323 [Hyphomicrobiales bacterium]|jgi:peptidoglycan/LPS O-acetylase OafA/YrhL|nr:hypothetical protein [Hyphomicrobiales bacterium]
MLYRVWPGIHHDFETATHIAINATMTMTWVPVTWANFSYNGPAWSIATEFGFYASFPLLIVAFDRTWWWKLALTVMLVIVLAAIAVYLKIPDGGEKESVTSLQSLLYMFPVARLFEFVCGMTAAMLWLAYRHRFELGAVVATALELTAVGGLAYSMRTAGRSWPRRWASGGM